MFGKQAAIHWDVTVWIVFQFRFCCLLFFNCHSHRWHFSTLSYASYSISWYASTFSFFVNTQHSPMNWYRCHAMPCHAVPCPALPWHRLILLTDLWPIDRIARQCHRNVPGARLPKITKENLVLWTILMFETIPKSKVKESTFNTRKRRISLWES